MRPANLTSRIFLDSGDPEETKKILDIMGFLDGQTTNPSLFAKNPAIIQKKAETGITKDDILPLYQNAVRQVSALIPQGSVSIEVFIDFSTSIDEMLTQAHEMYTWIPNAHIKFPTTTQGLEAAHRFSGEGKRINMTLCFSQEQGAAVYTATLGAKRGDVFLSPFVGRLDDIGEDGLSLIRNIEQMYTASDHHVEVLVASVRTVDHMMAALSTRCDILTVPYGVLEEWVKRGMPLPDEHFMHDTSQLQPIPYKELDLSANYTTFDISHPLTTKGIEKFNQDITALLS